MQSLTLFLALVLLASNAVDAGRFPRAVKGNGFLKVPVGTVERARKSKRDGEDPILTVLDNEDFFYATEIEFGTPPQSITVLVDTGSNELWVNPDCSTAGTQYQAEECLSYGFYDPDDSKTPAVGPLGRGEITYGDPTDPQTLTSVNIQYYRDTITLGDATIVNQTFGVATASEGQSQGIFGLAPDVERGFGGDKPYSMVLHSMAEQGIIESRLFALDLRHAEAQTGALIYGGVDRSKFIGRLETLPVIRGQQGEFRLAVELDTMGLRLDKLYAYELEGPDRNVMLDSGSTLTRMHYAAAAPILQALGVVDDGEGYYYVPCEARESGGSVSFGFAGKEVQVPFRDFILDSGGMSAYCAVGLVITEDQQILGDSVLRAGYFVFDWDNEAVHIAQAANCGDDDIVAVGSGSDALADVTGNCDEDDALFTGGPVPTATQSESEELPTGTYTTTYTITSCPSFDRGCSTGLVTTRTVGGSATARTTQTNSPGGENDKGGNDDGDDGHDGDDGDGGDGGDGSNGDNGDDEGAGVHGQALSLVLLTMGAVAGGMINVL